MTIDFELPDRLSIEIYTERFLAGPCPYAGYTQCIPGLPQRIIDGFDLNAHPMPRKSNFGTMRQKISWPRG